MPLAAHLCQAILNTALGQLALLFLAGAGGDMQAARDAATAILADYDPQTNEELALAADIVHGRFRAMEALGRSADPALPLTQVLRQRASAVSLSREAHKAQRKLDQLQRPRRTSARPARPAEVTPEPATAAADPAPVTPALAAAASATTAQVTPAPAPGPAPGPAQPPATEAAIADIARQAMAELHRHRNMGKYGGMTHSQMLQKRFTAQRMAESNRRRAAEAARQQEQAATSKPQAPASAPA
jgi:hypothetical protein